MPPRRRLEPRVSAVSRSTRQRRAEDQHIVLRRTEQGDGAVELSPRDEERARIADELHDGLAQVVHAALQEVRVARRAADENQNEAGKRLANAEALLLEAIGEIRRCVLGLRPGVLETQGFVSAIEHATLVLRRSLGPIDLLLDVSPPPQRLPIEFELAVYRVIQEALENIRKHARARSVRVKLSWLNGYADLEVIDDGVGPGPLAP